MVTRLAVLLAALFSAAASAGGEQPKLDYNRDVRPILSENCFHCHGADEAQRQADLRLDVRDSAIELGAIAPGAPAESSLVERINSDDPELKMPPAASKRQLFPAQIETLTRWVAEGAEYKPHWAFLPVQRPQPPEVELAGWPQNDVDRFVLAKLEQNGLAPSPRAPLPALLRRISFDVTGLPPTPKQLANWQSTADPIAAALDELLASPHFGERMAVDWLDVARYADTHGFNNDSARTMWRWRDWVVDAFNENLPYDQFIAKQLAGDLLPEATLEDRIATGFNRNHVINSEGGIIDEEYRVEYVADRVRTMSLAWLGLTLECARCHDHKFDPLSQRDYYSFFELFNRIDETGEDGRAGNAAPLMRAPTREQQRRYARMTRRDAKLEAQLKLVLAEAAPRELTTTTDKVAAGAKAPLDDEKRIALDVAAEVTQFPGEQTREAPVKSFDMNGGWLWTAWTKRTGNGAGPLISTMDFSSPPSSGGYGAGMQIGLTPEGAIDVRMAVRWPAYAMNVVSKEALPPSEWRHLAIRGKGNAADGIRIFIDGVEVETDVRHDDLTGNVSVNGSMHIGYSGEPQNNRFSGSLFGVQLRSGVVEEGRLEGLLAGAVVDLPPGANEQPALSWPQQLAAVITAPGAREQVAKLNAKWRSVRKQRLEFLRSFPTLMVAQDLPQARDTFVLERGQYDKPGKQVEPNVPSALGLPLPAEGPRDRRALAKWLTDSRHPLTSRVVVNRFWHAFFGVGLVKTVEDFGTRSELPSHPELLDWLAAEFIDSSWDVKKLVRMIVESATYQQDSSARPDRWAADPENRLLARGPRQRLTAEMLRDQALAVSELLVPRLGGPPVFPYQPADLYKGIVVEAGYPGTTYQPSTGEDLYRRSLYTFWKRTVPHPTLSTFDAPDREFCTGRRSITSTPLQALVLMNDPTYLEAARKLGERMLAEGGDSDSDRLAWGFELVAARAPKPAELARLLVLLKAQRTDFAELPPKGLIEVGDSKPSAALSEKRRELAAYANVASLLLNLDETVTRN